MKLKKVLLGLAASGLMLTGCGSKTAKDSDTYTIGGNFELSGQVSQYGIAMNEGAELAVELLNQDGGIDGKKVAYKSLDNKSEKTESASVATKLMTSEQVLGVVGPATTGDAQAQIPVAEKQKVPVVYPAATGDGLTLQKNGDVYPNIFRVCFVDSMQGILGAQLSQDRLHANKAAVIVDNTNDYSKNIAAAFEKEFKGKIVAKEVYQEKDTDFKAILTSLKDKDFDVIFVPGYYNEVGLIIKQAREMGIKQPIVGGDGLGDDKLIELAGENNMNDVYYLSAFYSENENEKVQAFVKAFKEKYNREPNQFAALTFDAVNVLAQAAKNAKSNDPQKVRAELEKIADFEGVTGTFTFDENHDPVKSATVIEIQNGQKTSSEINVR